LLGLLHTKCLGFNWRLGAQIIQQLGSLQAVNGPDPNYPDICYAGAGR
jgi:hypothetical protein